MNSKGWFKVAGVQDGTRTLEEQMQGIGRALREARGKTVLDAGCAEGFIAIEFAKAGAALVDAVDNNENFVRSARRYGKRLVKSVVHARFCDLNVGLPEGCAQSYEIVLALAILHKALDVQAMTRLLAKACSGLMVVRLPRKSYGFIPAKHGNSSCDLNEEMPALGFRLESVEQGPRDELVQYWRALGGRG
ncbi:MAG: class I SAM-dependent methyltransferase [Sulfuritalea sp.]|nr:class I SAM-dependent methyltransferase [Sulfuritalea sp.]